MKNQKREDKILRITQDILVGSECDGEELAEDVANELERRGFTIVGSGILDDVTNIYQLKTKYNDKQQQKINDWLESVGAPYLQNEEFFEYKDGQLLEIAEANEDSLRTWDEWQHVQALMGMEIPLYTSIRFVGMLWENDIEILELKNDRSTKYYKKIEEMLK